MIDKIISDYNYHVGSDYFKALNNQFHLLNSLIGLPNIKVRIFDNFFEGNFFIRKAENAVYISCYQRDDFNFKPYAFEPFFPAGRVFLIPNTITLLNCVGSYSTKDHIVLCSCPDARTLVRSYKNDVKTIDKLAYLINSSYVFALNMIRLAQNLVEKS